MAIFRTGPLTGAISGKIGGVVFVTGGKSNVVRHRPAPRTSTSPFLARSRSRMYNLRRHWSTLTSAQQSAWNTAARDILTANRLGQRSPMNGFQYFIMSNTKSFPGWRELIPFPPTSSPFDFAINPAANFSAAGAYNAQIDNPVPLAWLRIVVHGWPFWRTTQSRDIPRLVFIAELTSAADPVIVDVRDAWVDHFGALKEGQRFAVGITSQFTHWPFAPRTILRQAVTA